MTMRGEENNKRGKLYRKSWYLLMVFSKVRTGKLIGITSMKNTMNMQAGCSIEQTLYYSVAGHISLWLTIGQPRLQSRTIQS